MIGRLIETSEQMISFSRDPESVFYIKDSGSSEITICGFDVQAGLDTMESNKRVIKIEGTSKIRFEHITLVNGNLSADDTGPNKESYGGGSV